MCRSFKSLDREFQLFLNVFYELYVIIFDILIMLNYYNG